MACKLYFRFLILFVTTVFASARISRMVENHEASVPLANTMDDGNKDGKLKTDGSIPVPAPDRPMSLGGGEKVETDGEMKIGADVAGILVASEPLGWTPIETGGSGNEKGMMKTYSTARPDSIPIGVIPITPGGDGSFQFAIGSGPIGFGFGFGWGGLTPGYPHPYVVVSPYMGPHPTPGAPYFPPGVPFTSPAPYIPPIPYQPPMGFSPNLPPVPGFGTGQPAQGYEIPYPPCSSAPASLPAETGGSASEPQI